MLTLTSPAHSLPAGLIHPLDKMSQPLSSSSALNEHLMLEAVEAWLAWKRGNDLREVGFLVTSDSYCNFLPSALIWRGANCGVQRGQTPKCASSQPYLLKAQSAGTMEVWGWDLQLHFFLAYFKIGFQFLSTSGLLWKKRDLPGSLPG